MTGTKLVRPPVAARKASRTFGRDGGAALRAGVAALVLGSLFSACGQDLLCPEALAPAIALDVVDDETARPAWHGALAVASDGVYSDTLTSPLAEPLDSTVRGELVGALGREGVYAIRVQKSGYMTWERMGIVATRTPSPCSRVLTVHVQARLERSTPPLSPAEH